MRPKYRAYFGLLLSLVFVLNTSASMSLGQFTTVINVPPDIAPGSIGSDTQLNLADGGEIASSFLQPFQAGSPDGTSSNIEVNIVSGTVGDYFTAYDGTTIHIDGGAIGEAFTATGGSQVEVTGGQFTSDLTILDGSSLSFSGGSGGDFLGVGGASTAIFSGGSVNSIFADTGAMLTVQATATIGLMSVIQGAALEARGGSIGSTDAIGNSLVMIDGGAIDALQIDVASEAVLRSGSLGDVGVQYGTFHMSGGELSGQLQVNGDFSSAVIRGGDVSGILSVWGGQLELIGESFEIDGVPVAGITTPGQSIVVPERGGALLTGLLSDGSQIELALFDTQVPGEEGVSLNSTLRLTFVPEPGSTVLLMMAVGFTANRNRRR